MIEQNSITADRPLDDPIAREAHPFHPGTRGPVARRRVRMDHLEVEFTHHAVEHGARRRFSPPKSPVEVRRVRDPAPLGQMRQARNANDLTRCRVDHVEVERVRGTETLHEMRGRVRALVHRVLTELCNLRPEPLEFFVGEFQAAEVQPLLRRHTSGSSTHSEQYHAESPVIGSRQMEQQSIGATSSAS